jgi:hypothetical protein
MSDDATLTAAVVPPAEAPRTDAWSRRFSTIGAMFVTAMIFLLFVRLRRSVQSRDRRPLPG